MEKRSTVAVSPLGAASNVSKRLCASSFFSLSHHKIAKCQHKYVAFVNGMIGILTRTRKWHPSLIVGRVLWEIPEESLRAPLINAKQQQCYMFLVILD